MDVLVIEGWGRGKTERGKGRGREGVMLAEYSEGRRRRRQGGERRDLHTHSYVNTHTPRLENIFKFASMFSTRQE